MSREYSIIVEPEGDEITCSKGDNLLEVLNKSEIGIRSLCGGEGTCRQCLVVVEDGEFDFKSKSNLEIRSKEVHKVPSCQIEITGDLKIRIPDESRSKGHQILFDRRDDDKGILISEDEKRKNEHNLEPLFQHIHLKLEPPSYKDNTSDLDRLYQTLLEELDIQKEIVISNSTLQKLAKTLRENDWEVAVTLIETNGYIKLLNIEEAIEKTHYGLAVDVGTTSVVAQLFNLDDGSNIGISGTYNRQTRYGEDVISRINYSSSQDDGLTKLQKALITTLNQLIDDLCTKADIDSQCITLMTCAGNTTMLHTLYNIDPHYLRKSPYVPTVSTPPSHSARELNLNIWPDAEIFGFPSVGSFVGGDIVAGVLSQGFGKSEELTLFIDIGTNGEIVLGNKDFLMTCSASAGPAFEGGGITCGMRAMEGAIEGIEITGGYEVSVKTVKNLPPVGLCGTGLIDTLATLEKADIINRSGQFNDQLETPRLRENEEGHEFVLVFAEDAGIEDDITITTGDIKNLMRSKAAVYAAVRVMLNNLSLQEDMIERILIAGGFGNYLNLKAAVQIGLLPDLPLERFEFVGNTSLSGAREALLSKSVYIESKKLAERMTYIELSAEDQSQAFTDEFIAAQFIPHTDLSLFPSIDNS